MLAAHDSDQDRVTTMPASLDEVRDLRLDAFVDCARSRRLDEYMQYFKSKQHERKRYSWDGRMVPLNVGDADIEPGYYVPLAQRRPSATLKTPRKIVWRFTSMTLGGERFPKINVHGDDEAEDWCQELVRVSMLEAKMVEARNKGGACGTAVVSWAFVDGKPRVNVHSAQRCHVLRWADRDARRPATVLECYRFERTMIVEGKPKLKKFFFARMWTETEETIWDAIPEELAKEGTWPGAVKHYTVEHGFGFCPVYWVQNIDDSENDDGESDYESQLDNFDEMDQIASTVGKGTKGNVDPTLVINADPKTANNGSVRKGSENAIYSEKGADYLTLPGDAFKAAMDWLSEMKADSAETSNVVFPSPEALAKAMSAAALRIIYGPMLTQCDSYRTQYGRAIERIVRDMLDVSRRVLASEPGEVMVTSEGHRIQHLPSITLDDRVIETKNEDGTITQSTKKRSPGSSSNVILNWPPYFPDTWTDIQMAVTASVAATGGKAVLSQETAVKNIAPKFGALNAEEELERIDEDAEKAMERDQVALEGQLKSESLYGSPAAEVRGKDE